MPRPVYTLCVHSYSEDKDSQLVSFFEVVEKLQVAPLPAPGQGKPIIVLWKPIRMISTWMLNPGESFDDQYEFELRLLMPEGNAVPLASGTFQFGQPDRQPLHRFVVRFDAPFPVKGQGIMRAESRIRKVGTETWSSQDYPVILEPIQSAELNGPPPKPEGDGTPESGTPESGTDSVA